MSESLYGKQMNTNLSYPGQIQPLPIAPYLDDICTALKNSPSHFLVLTAETAAGKSTAVPFALLRHFSGKCIMLEPRRIAALAVASRVSELLGEEPGETAGYVMHLESRVSGKTRFTVMTEAVLERMLQDDPSLAGISVVVIDEFHERSVHADLSLAFLKESMELRDDLFVIVMSATIDTQQLSSYLGTGKEPAPVFSVPGRQYPVTTEYAGGITPAEAVLKELHKSDSGSILVFLPGIGDIRHAYNELKDAGTDAELLMLHSSVSFAEQKRVLDSPHAGDPRRVILSSAIAETSLTVPGVTVVIDSGLARVNRMNIAAGMEALTTERESVFSAQQRRGRAGRTAPGRCVCLWNESDARTLRMPPEILRADLVPLVLECARWGVSDPDRLSWLDRPSDASWNSAQQLLCSLGCLEKTTGEAERMIITPLGKAALSLGLHPRLACAALSGIFSGDTVSSVKCALKYSTYADAAPSLQKRFCSDLEQRIARVSGTLCSGNCADGRAAARGMSASSFALLSGFPDRLARLCDISGVYRFPSGRIASLPGNERQNTSGFPEWIAAPEADAGEREGRIYSYEEIPAEEALVWLEGRTENRTSSEFADGTRRILKTESVCYGKITISSKKVAAVPGDFADAACAAVEKNGFGWLPSSERISEFLVRAEFYGKHDCGSGYLASAVREWLPPFLTGTAVTEESVYQALRYFLDGDSVDKNVPQRITMPNGKSYRLSYEKNGGEIRPVLEIIIQQIFGCFETPRVAGVPVLVKLLSPARRPLQITDDLAGFWKNTWPEVCREMKGRYPKHNWDYRVAEKD